MSGARMSSHESRPEGSSVAFLVGAGRSGTTLLYKLLCLHPQVAYISNYENRLRWFPDGLAGRLAASRTEHKLQAWFRKGGNAYFVKRPWLKKLFPTPHEGEAVFAACGLPLFPTPDYMPDAATARRLGARFEGIRHGAGAALFLSKRTANNRRIPQLSAVFPGARYVHLVRDGREVAQSLAAVEWWDGHTIWWDGRTALEMEQAGEPRLAICARNWVREMQELRSQLALIDRRQLIEVRFEDLLNDPMRHLADIVRFLGLEFSPDYQRAIEALAMRPSAPKWQSTWRADELACVMREAQPMLRDLGYLEPA